MKNLLKFISFKKLKNRTFAKTIKKNNVQEKFGVLTFLLSYGAMFTEPLRGHEAKNVENF